MFVNVAVLKETLPHEHRVAMIPALVPRLMKLGAARSKAPAAWRLVETEVDKLSAVRSVEVDVAAQTVTVEGEAADEEIRSAIEEAGYDVGGAAT